MKLLTLVMCNFRVLHKYRALVRFIPKFKRQRGSKLVGARNAPEITERWCNKLHGTSWQTNKGKISEIKKKDI